MKKHCAFSSLQAHWRRFPIAAAVMALMLLSHPSVTPSVSARDVIGPASSSELPPVSAADLLKIEKQIQSARAKVIASCVAVLDANGDTPAGASGTIISPDGLILSHCHGGQMPGTAVRVMLGDGRTASAKYLGVHRTFDMSLIKIDGDGPWPAVEIASASDVGVGDFCLAMSYPGTYFQLGREPLLRMSCVIELTSRGIYSGMVLKGGDSGGPIFNAYGKLIGIHSSTDGPHSYHARADLLSKIRQDLLNSKLVLNSDFSEPFDRTKFASLAERSHNSVVRVYCNGDQVAMGLIIAEDGWIVTKASELINKDDTACRLSDGRSIKAVVRETDWQHDLALLQVEATSLPIAPWSEREPTVGAFVATVDSARTLMGLGTIGSPIVEVPPVKGALAIEVEPAPNGVDGVRVKNALYPLTAAVVKSGDVITHFEGKAVRTVAEFEDYRTRYEKTRQAMVGNKVDLTVLRNQRSVGVRVPIEFTVDPKKPRTGRDSRFADRVPDHHGRHAGFPTVFMHNGLTSKEQPKVLGDLALAVRRRELGGPVVDSHGMVIGINIGSFEAKHVCALPISVVRTAVAEMQKRIAQSVVMPKSGLPVSTQKLSAAPTPREAKELVDLEPSLRAACAKVTPATIAIFSKANGAQIGSGTLISSDGLVLTHGQGVIGKRRIGMTFDVKLGDGRTTTGKYLGVHRGYQMSLMRLDGSGPWPAVDIGMSGELKASEFCLAVGYPTGYYREGRPPLVRLTRSIGVSKVEIDVPIKVDLGDIGGPLFNLRGQLVGVCHAFDQYLRADLLAEIRNDLLSGGFTLKKTRPDPYDTSTLADLSTPVHRSVVRVLYDGEQVALGLVVSADGRIITKASNLLGNRFTCEFSDGRRLIASLQTSSSIHDIALVKVDASELAVPEWSSRAPDVGTILATVGPDKQPLNIGVAGSSLLSIPRDLGQLGFKARAVSGSAEGVVVSEILFALTNEILKVGDVITEFNGQPVRNMDDFRREERRFLDSTTVIAGGRVAVSLQRDKSPVQLRLPIESLSEANRGRPLGDKFAPLPHLDLQGRHTGFGEVFMHDALVRRPRPANIFTPYISRKDFGSPIVNLSGKIVGLNIGSQEGFFTYAIPMHVVQGIVAELSTAAKQMKTPKEVR